MCDEEVGALVSMCGWGQPADLAGPGLNGKVQNLVRCFCVCFCTCQVRKECFLEGEVWHGL